MLMTKLSSINTVANIVVARPRKSAVRRTPKTVPIDAPPNDPANPPPLLDCIRTTIIRNTLIKISKVTKIPNMILPEIIDFSKIY